jgi:hypothetical protein
MTMQSWTDERLDNVISVFAAHLTAISNSQVNLAEFQAEQARSQTDITKRVEEAHARSEEARARYEQIHARHEEALVTLYESVRDIRQNLVELRAGQERQERILDYLIRQEGKNP